MNNHTATINGILGTTTSAGAAILSALPEVEAWLRVIGAVVAILSGLLTCCYMLKQLRKK